MDAMVTLSNSNSLHENEVPTTGGGLSLTFTTSSKLTRDMPTSSPSSISVDTVSATVKVAVGVLRMLRRTAGFPFQISRPMHHSTNGLRLKKSRKPFTTAGFFGGTEAGDEGEGTEIELAGRSFRALLLRVAAALLFHRL